MHTSLKSIKKNSRPTILLFRFFDPFRDAKSSISQTHHEMVWDGWERTEHEHIHAAGTIELDRTNIVTYSHAYSFKVGSMSGFGSHQESKADNDDNNQHMPSESISVVH